MGSSRLVVPCSSLGRYSPGMYILCTRSCGSGLDIDDNRSNRSSQVQPNNLSIASYQPSPTLQILSPSSPLQHLVCVGPVQSKKQLPQLLQVKILELPDQDDRLIKSPVPRHYWVLSFERVITLQRISQRCIRRMPMPQNARHFHRLGALGLGQNVRL